MECTQSLLPIWSNGVWRLPSSPGILGFHAGFGARHRRQSACSTLLATRPTSRASRSSRSHGWGVTGSRASKILHAFRSRCVVCAGRPKTGHTASVGFAHGLAETSISPIHEWPWGIILRWLVVLKEVGQAFLLSVVFGERGQQ